jgi:phage-related protein
MKMYADTGELDVPHQLNELEKGEIWEFKAGTLRAPFYVTHSSECGDLRITHCFWKKSRSAPRHEIDKAKGIKREDGLR